MAVRGFILAGVTAGGTIHSCIVPLRSFIPVADLNRSGDESGARGLSRAATPGPGFPLRGVDCYPPAARLGFLLAIHRGDRPLQQPRRPTRQPPLSEMGVASTGEAEPLLPERDGPSPRSPPLDSTCFRRRHLPGVWRRTGIGCYSSLGIRAPHAFPVHSTWAGWPSFAIFPRKRSDRRSTRRRTSSSRRWTPLSWSGRSHRASRWCVAHRSSYTLVGGMTHHLGGQSHDRSIFQRIAFQ